MKPYPAYKPTGLKWLPEVPRGWEVLHIRELFSERRVKVSDKDYPPLSVSRGGIVPQIETVAKSDDGDNRKLVKKGDFVINSRSDRKSSSGVSQLDGSVSLINIVLEPRDQLTGSYAHYLLKCNEFVEEFYRNGRGIVGDLWTTRYSEMKSISLPVPTLEEQAKMSVYLDDKTAKIDRLIKLKEREIELLQEKKQAVISKVVTRGLDPNVKLVDSGVDWIGKVPCGWKVMKLSFRYSIQLGKMLDSKRAIGSHMRRYLRNQDVQWDFINIEDLPQMDIAPDEMERFSAQKGDLLMCEGGEIGRCSVWRNEQTICFQKAIIRLRPRNVTIDNVEFLWNLFRAASAHEAFANATGKATIAHLPAEKLAAVRLPFPPLAEQREIVAYLDAEMAKTDRAIAVVRRQIDLLREYRTRLISDVVTGRIDVREVVA